MRSALNKPQGGSSDPTLSWGYSAAWIISAVVIAAGILWSSSLIGQGDIGGGVAVGLAIPGIGTALLLVLNSDQRPLRRWVVRVIILVSSALLFLALSSEAQASSGEAGELISPSIATAGWLGVLVAVVGDLLNDYYPKYFSPSKAR